MFSRCLGDLLLFVFCSCAASTGFAVADDVCCVATSFVLADVVFLLMCCDWICCCC